MFNPFKRPASTNASTASNLSDKVLRIAVEDGVDETLDLSFYGKGFAVEDEATVVAILSAAAKDFDYDVIKNSHIVSSAEPEPTVLDVTVFPVTSDNEEEYVTYTDSAGNEVTDFDLILNVIELSLNSYGYDLVA